MEITKGKTSRGFPLNKFKDFYGCECSIQLSSLATEAAIWIGIDNPNPRIMASNATRLGVLTDQTTGWIEFEIPPEVLISTRMHLTQNQVKELIPILQYFAEHGDLPE